MGKEYFDYIKQRAKSKATNFKDDIDILKEKFSSQKYSVKPVVVETRAELATAVLEKEKIIYVVGRYWHDVKEDINENRISFDVLSKEEAKKYTDDMKHTFIRRLGEAFNVPDSVTKEFRNYKVKKK